MEEILASILQGEGVSSLYGRYTNFLVASGYVDCDGVPQRCPICGSEHLIKDNAEIGGFNIPEGCMAEYDSNQDEYIARDMMILESLMRKGLITQEDILEESSVDNLRAYTQKRLDAYAE